MAMKSFVSFIVVAGACLIVLACSGSGSRQIAGTQCPEDYTPIPVDIPDAQKLSLKTAAGKDLLPATYVYQGADLYYVSPQDFRVQVRHAKLADGTFQAVTNCVRNAKAAVPGTSLTVDGISSLVVDENFKVTANQSSYGFTYTSGHLVPTVSLSDETTTDLEKPFAKGVTTFLVKVAEKTYDLRSVGGSDVEGKYVLSIHFTQP